MKYEDALRTSLDSCWSYVYHKYTVNPSIMTMAITVTGLQYSFCPFALNKRTDGALAGLIDTSDITEGYNDLSIEGALPEDCADANIALTLLPYDFPIINKAYKPSVYVSTIRNFEQRTKDTIAMIEVGRLACHKFFNGLRMLPVYHKCTVTALMHQLYEQLDDDPNFDTSYRAEEFRRMAGPSDKEYLYLLTKLNDLLVKELYEPLHLTDPDAIYYLYRDTNRFCEEYRMDGAKREVVSLYRDCFLPFYRKIYAHVMHYGNQRFLRIDDSREEVLNALREMKNGSDYGITVSMTSFPKGSNNLNDAEFEGSDAIEYNQGPCSVGMSSIYFMKLGGNDESI